MNCETFNEFIAPIPYRPAREYATGVLAPLLRSMGHILYLTAILAQETNNEGEIKMPEEEKQNELNHAAAHLDATPLANDTGTFSTNAKANILTYATAVAHARDSFHNWTPQDRLICLRNLANRAAGLAASLDRELIGLTPENSDPGTSF
jgi:hypothetical protein